MKTIDDLQYAPRMLGSVFYPAGFPVRPDDMTFCLTTDPADDGFTITELMHRYYEFGIDDAGGLIEPSPLSADEIAVLTEWIIYYLHAPIWQSGPHGPMPGFDSLLRRALAIDSLAAMREVAFDAIDFGLDPL